MENNYAMKDTERRSERTLKELATLQADFGWQDLPTLAENFDQQDHHSCRLSCNGIYSFSCRAQLGNR